MGKRRRRKTPEQAFEYRIERLLRKADFLTLNCTRSRPFDIIAVKRNVGIPIELKARTGSWSNEQQEFQEELAWNSENGFTFIRQITRRNKSGYMMDVIHYVYNMEDDWYVEATTELVEALGDSVNSIKVIRLE